MRRPSRDRFAALYGEQVREDIPLFDAFYRQEFQQAKAFCGFTPKARAAVEACKAAGHRVALATNPIFPAVATESRIRWAGLAPETFAWYTTYENIGYCKPNPDYYREILRYLGCRAEDCLMVGNDVDIGWYYNAIMGGMYSRIMANYIGAIMTLADNSPYIPDYLTFDTYNSQNWAEAIVATSTANGIPRNQLMAFGDYRDLQKVLPLGTPSDAALTYGLGEEWMRNGFLSVVGGVPLFDVDPAMVPGTVNTTGEMLGMKGLILISGRIGRAYAPVYTAFAEGSPLVIEMEPRESGDNSIYIDCTAVMDTKIVMGSKVAAIQMPS